MNDVEKLVRDMDLQDFVILDHQKGIHSYNGTHNDVWVKISKDYFVNSENSYEECYTSKKLKGHSITEDVDSIEIKTDDVSVVIDSAESVEKEEEIEIENIDKDTIEDAVEECLTESFTNVKFFKASDIIQRKNRFIVEGIIGFKSGKKKNTNFVFRPSLLNESKIVFRGFNRDLKESVKSISLNCKKQGNKIIVESYKVSK